MICSISKRRFYSFCALPLFLPVEEKPLSLDPDRILPRVVVLGASVSDGFQNGMPLGRLFDAAIRLPHEPVESITSSVFFMDPVKEGARQLSLCAKRGPSLVLGADFLFWYGYGEVGAKVARTPVPRVRPEESEDAIRQRLERLDRALLALDAFSCPLVLGDFPDMWGADPKMIPHELIPGAKALDRLNGRLREWAKSRPRVLLLPLAQWVLETKEGRAKLPGREKEPAIPARVLLQEDRLHPTQAGAIVLTGRIVHAMRSWIGDAAGDKLRYDAAKALEDEGIEF